MGEAEVSSVPPQFRRGNFICYFPFFPSGSGKGGGKDPKRLFCGYQRPYAGQCCVEESLTRARLKFIRNEIQRGGRTPLVGILFS